MKERFSTSKAAQLLGKLGVLLLLGCAVFSFAHGIERASLERVLRGMGGGVGLLVVPPLLALLVETLGWNHALVGAGVFVRFPRLFLIRGATESLATFLPGGALLGESVKPVLLEREGVRLSVAVGAIAHRKYLRVFAHGLFLVSVALFGSAVLERFSRETLGFPGLSVALLGVGALLGGSVEFARAGLAKGNYASRTLSWARARFPKLRAHARIESAFENTDEATRRFFSLPPKTTLPALFACFVAWVLESSEAFLLLRLLDQDVAFVSVLALDAGVSLLRQAAVFLPGGVLVQELGYFAVLPVLGVTDAVHVGAAFVLVKRVRELVMGLGFALFFLENGAKASSRRALVGT